MLKLSDLAERPDFRAGEIDISPSRRRVRGPAGEIQLEPLVMHMFLLLLDAGGRVVTRNELFDACWGGAMVGDDSLNRGIAGVRRIAAEVAPRHFEVETIPRTGYRLTGAIFDQPEEQEGEQPPGQAAAPLGMSRRVLLGGSAATVLASIGVWTFLRPSTDARFSHLVEEADQILRHEYSERRSSAIPLLQEAQSIHPSPAALGLLAYARALEATSGSREDVGKVAQADRAIKAALSADSDDPHARLALLLFQKSGFEWVAIEDELLRVLRTAPRNTLALNWLVALYQAAGRNQLSWNFNEKVVRIDPLSPLALHRKALKHWNFGRTAEAYRVIDQVIQLWPRHPWVWNARFLIFAFTGRAHAALDMIEDSTSRPTNITPQRMAQWRPTLAALEYPSPVSVAAARDANLAAAKQSPGQAAFAVMALSGIGEIDAAYEVAQGFLLSRGNIVTRRPSDPGNMLVNNLGWRNTQWLSTPPIAKFRSDPRFGPLCEEIGLAAYWHTRGIRPDYPSFTIA